jgi:hypothetical protein
MMHTGGYKAYWCDYKRHQLNGPAVIYDDGSEEYWEYGVRIR